MNAEQILSNYLNLARLNLYGLTKMHEQGYDGRFVKVGNMDVYETEHGYNVESNIIEPALGGQIFGTAPSCELKRYPLPKVFDEKDIVKALKKCVIDGMDIINMSFGTPTNYIAVERQIQECKRLGIIMIAAAGNRGKYYRDNYDIKLYPEEYVEVVSVGSVDSNLEWSDFESHGRSIDLVGIGRSAVIKMIDLSYQYGTGTSFSSPQITGLFASVKSMFIQQGVIHNDDSLKEYIFSKCVDLGKLGKDNFYGHGFPTMDIEEWHEMYLELNGITKGVLSERVQRIKNGESEEEVNKCYNIIDNKEYITHDGSVIEIPIFNLKEGANG